MKTKTIFICLIFITVQSLGCSCKPTRFDFETRSTYFENSEYVMLCKVFPDNKITPLEIFKGDSISIDSMLFMTQVTSCDLSFNQNSIWVLYISDNKGNLTVDVCAPNIKISNIDWEYHPIPPENIQENTRKYHTILNNKINTLEHLNWLRNKKLMNELESLKYRSLYQKEDALFYYVCIFLIIVILFLLIYLLKRINLVMPAKLPLSKIK
jgi:hypothetical protein